MYAIDKPIPNSLAVVIFLLLEANALMNCISSLNKKHPQKISMNKNIFVTISLSIYTF